MLIFCYPSLMEYFTVSQLNRAAQEILIASLGPEVWVVGEIHGFKVHSKSMHVYFDLVEKPHESSENYVAKVSCAFFRGAFARWRERMDSEGFDSFTLKDGMEIKLRASVDLYVKEGRYQLVVSEIDPNYTLGAIERKRLRTIEKLRSMGLLVRNKALEIARPPVNIGLITSRGSAAYNDFISILKNSGYAFRVKVFDAHMQGRPTVEEVVDGIRVLSSMHDIDIIAIVRGGGARTDLFYFDDISLCTAIGECRVPVVTGIGHEIDVSVADMVACRHFVTPTDVARFLVGEVDGFWTDLAGLVGSMHDIASRSMESLYAELERVSQQIWVFTHRWIDGMEASINVYLRDLSSSAIRRLSENRNHVDNLGAGAYNAASAIFKEASYELTKIGDSLCRGFVLISRDAENRLMALLKDVKTSANGLLSMLDSVLGNMEGMISAMDPVSVMKRGYSITIGEAGNTIRDSMHVRRGEIITTLLYKGSVKSQVTKRQIT